MNEESLVGETLLSLRACWRSASLAPVLRWQAWQVCSRLLGLIRRQAPVQWAGLPEQRCLRGSGVVPSPLPALAAAEKVLRGEDSWPAVLGSMDVGSDVAGSGVARESRRRRTIWQAWQKKALLAAFSKNSYPSFEDRKDLASQMGIPESRIRVWFQNRRNRTGEVGRAPKSSTRSSKQLASQQLTEAPGSRTQGRGMPSDNRRPRTRLTSPQRRILVQAFERKPLPDFATREELVRRTGLPEDTIYIWFQNRRARHLSRGRLPAQDQDLLASPRSHGAPRGLGGRKHEGAQGSLLPLAAAGAVEMETARSSDLPALGTESQLPHVAQPSGASEAQAPTQASNTGPLELLLDQVLDQVQVEEQAPAALDLGGREDEGAQDSLLPLAEAGWVGMDPWSPIHLPSFCRDSQPRQVAQTSGAAPAQAPTRSSNTDPPLDLFLDQLLTKVQVEEQAPGPLDLENEWEQMDTLPELPLTPEDYQALLDTL